MAFEAAVHFDTDVVRVEDGSTKFSPYASFATQDTLKTVNMSYAHTGSEAVSFVVPGTLPTGWTAGEQKENTIQLTAAAAGAVSISEVIESIELQTQDPSSIQTVNIDVVSDQFNVRTLAAIYTAVGKDAAFIATLEDEAKQQAENIANAGQPSATGEFLSYQMSNRFDVSADGKTLIFQVGHIANYDLTEGFGPPAPRRATVPGETIDVFRMQQLDDGTVRTTFVLEGVPTTGGDMFISFTCVGDRYAITQGLPGSGVYESNSLYLFAFDNEGNVTNTGGSLLQSSSDYVRTAFVSKPTSNNVDSCLWARQATNAQDTASENGAVNLYHRRNGEIIGPITFFFDNASKNVIRTVWSIVPLGGYKYALFSTQSGGLGTSTPSGTFMAIYDGDTTDTSVLPTVKSVTGNYAASSHTYVSLNPPMVLLPGPTGVDDAASTVVLPGSFVGKTVGTVYSIDYNAAAPALTEVYDTISPALATGDQIYSLSRFGADDTFMITTFNTLNTVVTNAKVAIYKQDGTTATTLTKQDDAAVVPTSLQGDLFGGGGSGAAFEGTSGFTVSGAGVAVYAGSSTTSTREIVVRSGPAPEPTNAPSGGGDWDFNHATLVATVVAAVLGVAVVVILAIWLSKKMRTQ